MTWVHIWHCGRWIWRLLTIAARAALPHVTAGMIVLRRAALIGAIGCVGIAIPVPGPEPVEPLVWLPGPWIGPSVSGGPGGDVATRDVPEPGTMTLFIVGIVGLMVGRRTAK